MSKIAQALAAAAGNAAAAGGSLYVEDVFSTYLYEGNGFYPSGGGQTITNGIDLDGEGGMIWIKVRNPDGRHGIYDTERGINQMLGSDETWQQYTDNAMVSANSDGFTLGDESSGWTRINLNGNDYVSWTFRKAEKFFDVVTYTGTGTPQTVSHNLGVAPAFIITKKTSDTSNWATNDPSQANPWSGALLLNSPSDFTTASTVWNNTAPTDSVFTVGTADATNVSEQTYVAYLFASDAGGFGDDGSESIIKCGSFTASQGVEVDLGFEPQWVLVKSATSTADWYMFDNIRGWGADRGSNDSWLFANTSGAETNSTNSLGLTPTGFISFNGGGQTYIYIAIRRPMKTPESGTEVFKTVEQNWSTGILDAGFPVDLAIFQTTDAGNNGRVVDRLRGNTQLLYPNDTFAESSEGYYALDNNDGFELVSSPVSNNWVWWMFKRATGFFDVVAYVGNRTNGASQIIPHNLKVTPEMILVKNRTEAQPWQVYSEATGNTKALYLSETNGATTDNSWGDTSPTATNFTVGDDGATNNTGNNFIAYLFATLDGVSKVGSFSHTQGTATNIDCGFSNGARFVLWKKYDGSDGWQVYDSVRGINAGADPFLQLDSDAAEISEDLIDPYAPGFSVASGKNSGNYIFLAIS